MDTGAFERAVKLTTIPKRYIRSEMPLHPVDGVQRWSVLVSDPTGGAAPRMMVLTEKGDLLPVPVSS